jgi:hypothetical protein
LVSGEIQKHQFIAEFYNVDRSKFKGNAFMVQAEKNVPDAKIPVVVVHTTGKRHEQDIVLIREIYWNSLLEKFFDK